MKISGQRRRLLLLSTLLVATLAKPQVVGAAVSDHSTLIGARWRQFSLAAAAGPVSFFFGWNPVAGAVQYGFEYTGPDRQFANPNGTSSDPINGFGGAGGGTVVRGTLLSLTVASSTPPGNYQFRVIGLTAAGRTVGLFSNAHTLSLRTAVSFGPIDIFDVRVEDFIPSNSTIPIGCNLNVLAMNRTQRFLTVSLIYQAFDRNGNGLGPASAGGSLAGSQVREFSGLTPATALHNGGADCSGIDRLELDTTLSMVF